MKVNGKVLVVTGAGSGMGRELTLQLLAKGARVAAVDIHGDALDELASAANAGERLSKHVADIADKQAIQALYEAVVEHHRHVDGVFNNAGIIQPFEKLIDLDDDRIEKVMAVNFFGVLHMIRTFLPHLLERPEAHIVNTSSMGGFLPVPGQAVYGASKAAVKLMSEALYAELMDTSVHVTVVFPGAIETNITVNSKVKTPSLAGDSKVPLEPMPASDAAAKIIAGVEHDRYHVMVGPDAVLLDKLCRIAPKRALSIIQKQMKGLLEQD
ncbi:SDR family oxidoreductase [Pseudenhygromyxa sp. WMMC2535]|uniref:SDR family NAD(P)-dependent oxidoreductase n=1 Tax=Pseudenhygromyxa sp. WMMC2535 TaxID=2712867 RepID=UPI0015563441|nr:SDR family oxidoreductase [Pseudenhygromyxa sp. WMMC2535]NVB39546.1 SDR family oxidoreductase [Pseudenhygromyxa sp. WMMC2535]